MHRQDYGVRVAPAPYEGAFCQYFNRDTGRCAKNLEYRRAELHACRVGFTFCPKWRESGDYGYSSMRDDPYHPAYGYTAFVSYRALEHLGENPANYQLEFKCSQ